MRTNRLLTVMTMSMAVSCLFSCSTDDDDDLIGVWERRSDFEGVARSGAVTFTVNDRVFVGLGYDGDDYLTDFWEYDQSKNTWYQVADFPGTPRTSAVAFSAGGKGYVGTGYDGTNYFKDFWEYDPGTDTWQQIEDFPGSARYGAIAFAIDDKGYVGAGYDDNFLKDFYEYDPTGGWEKKVSIGGTKIRDGFAFVMGGKGYVGGGNNNGSYVDELWAYDPGSDVWEEKRDLIDEDDEYWYDPPAPREDAVTFVIGDRAYLCTGYRSGVLGDLWEYNPADDSWEDLEYLEGSARQGAVGFAIGDRGYVTTGRSSSLRFDDLWELNPYIYDED